MTAEFDSTVDTIQIPEELYLKMVETFDNTNMLSDFVRVNATEGSSKAITNKFCDSNLGGCLVAVNRICSTFENELENSILNFQFEDNKTLSMRHRAYLIDDTV